MRTLKPKNKSGFEESVTSVTVPFGRTSSYASTLSRARPYWLVSQEYPLGLCQNRLIEVVCIVSKVPPPSVNPPTPTPVIRPPTTFTPNGSRAA